MSKIPPHEADSHPSNKHTHLHTHNFYQTGFHGNLYIPVFHVILLSIVELCYIFVQSWVCMKKMICFSHYHSRWICGFLAICTHQYSSTWHYPAPSVWESVCVCMHVKFVFWCLSVSTVCLGAQILASMCVRAVGALRQASIIRKTDHLTQALARRLNLDPTSSSRLRALSKKSAVRKFG